LKDLSSSYYGCEDAFEMEQKNTPTQRMSVSDHMNGFQYPTEKVDGYVIDMEAFVNKDSSANANSRITV